MTYTKGNGNIVVLIVVVLAVIAFVLFRKTNDTSIVGTFPDITSEQVETVQTVPVQTETTPATQEDTTIQNISSDDDFSSFETQTEAIGQEVNDLLFDDLGL